MNYVFIILALTFFSTSYTMQLKELVHPNNIQINFAKNDNEVLLCLWENCNKVAFAFDDLQSHVAKDHYAQNRDNRKCKWQCCDAPPFQTSQGFSLHIHHHVVYTKVASKFLTSIRSFE